MVEKDVMVIVPTGEYSGIRMWKSEAERQGLKYKMVGKQPAGAIEDKMAQPVEDKAVPKETTRRKTTKK